MGWTSVCCILAVTCALSAAQSAGVGTLDATAPKELTADEALKMAEQVTAKAAQLEKKDGQAATDSTTVAEAAKGARPAAEAAADNAKDAAKAAKEEAKDQQEKQQAATKAADKLQASKDKLAREQKEEADKQEKASNKGAADFKSQNEITDAARKEEAQKDKDKKVQQKKFDAAIEAASESPAVQALLAKWDFVRKDGVQTAVRNTPEAESSSAEGNKDAPSAKPSAAVDEKAALEAACKACKSTCKTDVCQQWCATQKACTGEAPAQGGAAPGSLAKDQASPAQPTQAAQPTQPAQAAQPAQSGDGPK